MNKSDPARGHLLSSIHSFYDANQHKHGKVGPHCKVIWFFVVKMIAVLSALHFLTLSGSKSSAQLYTIIDAAVGQDVPFPVENQCEDQLVVTFQLLSPVVAVLASRGTSMSERQHPVYKDRLYWSINGSLVLSNVQVNDSQRYETKSTATTNPQWAQLKRSTTCTCSNQF